MSSLVLELQAECLSDAPVTRLLTRAKVIAAKLDLGPTVTWIDSELDGYKSNAGFPDYRYVPGELVYFNPLYQVWQTILIPDPEFAKIFVRHPVYSPIAEIEQLVAHKDLYLGLPPDAVASLRKMMDWSYDIRYHSSGAQFVRILESVRQRLVDWTIKLERDGIVGEGVTFNSDEKHKVDEARNVYNINVSGNYAGAIGPFGDGATVNVTQTIQGVDPGQLQALLQDLRQTLGDTAFKGREDVEESLAKLEQEAASGEPRKKTVLGYLAAVKGLVGKAAGFAGRVAIEHGIDNYIDSLPL